MQDTKYLMENDEEVLRLELKTNVEVVGKQATWAGIKAGMRVADIGCGSGKTTAILHELVQPGGTAVGVDRSEARIKHAKEQYGNVGVEFECKDILNPLQDLGKFDFIWVRFLLEYYRSNSIDILNNLSSLLNPGGILCLIDLDHNSLSHYGLSQKLERTFFSAMKVLEEKADFDPYIGRKLYSFLYDLGYQDIDVDVGAHHLLFGELRDVDSFNWMKKAEVAAKKVGFNFEEYEGGYEGFIEEFKRYFVDTRRFAYSPIISCRGCKP